MGYSFGSFCASFHKQTFSRTPSALNAGTKRRATTEPVADFDEGQLRGASIAREKED